MKVVYLAVPLICYSKTWKICDPLILLTNTQKGFPKGLFHNDIRTVDHWILGPSYVCIIIVALITIDCSLNFNSLRTIVACITETICYSNT